MGSTQSFGVWSSDSSSDSATNKYKETKIEEDGGCIFDAVGCCVVIAGVLTMFGSVGYVIVKMVS